MNKIEIPLKFLEWRGKLVPCHPNSKQPIQYSWNKSENCIDFKEELMDVLSIPDVNLALLCDGYLCIDIDYKSNEAVRYENLEERLDAVDTYCQSTPSGGKHYLFRLPKGCRNEFKNLANILPNVDIRTNGGMMMIPPSIVDGKGYTPLNPKEPIVIPDKFAHFLTLLIKNKLHEIRDLKPGNRNVGLNKTIYKMSKKFEDHKELFKSVILDLGLSLDLEKDEIESTFESAMSAPHRDYVSITSSNPLQDFKDFFIEKYGKNTMMINHRIHHYNGACWSEKTYSVSEFISFVAAKHKKDPEYPASLKSDVGQFKLAQNKNTLVNLISNVANEYWIERNVSPKEIKWNANLKNWLPFNNGKINLMTGELEENNPEDFNRRVVDADYRKNVDTSVIDEYIKKLLYDPDLSKEEYQMKYENFRKMLGYLCYGHAEERIVFFLLGAGANGKTQLMNFIGQAVGENFFTRGTPTFLRGSQNAINTAEIDATQSRIVSIPEIERKINIDTLKNLTDGNLKSLRKMYTPDMVKIDSVAKYVIDCNRLPDFPLNDGPIEDRVFVFEFKMRFVTHPEKKNELPAINMQKFINENLDAMRKYLVECAKFYHENPFVKPFPAMFNVKKFSSDAISQEIRSLVDKYFIPHSKGKCKASVFKNFIFKKLNEYGIVINASELDAHLRSLGIKSKKLNSGNVYLYNYTLDPVLQQEVRQFFK